MLGLFAATTPQPLGKYFVSVFQTGRYESARLDAWRTIGRTAPRARAACKINCFPQRPTTSSEITVDASSSFTFSYAIDAIGEQTHEREHTHTYTSNGGYTQAAGWQLLRPGQVISTAELFFTLDNRFFSDRDGRLRAERAER